MLRLFEANKKTMQLKQFIHKQNEKKKKKTLKPLLFWYLSN